MTGEHLRLKEEQDASHEETLQVLKDADHAIASAQEVLSAARQRLQAATKKYEERLHGPTDIGSN